MSHNEKIKFLLEAGLLEAALLEIKEFPNAFSTFTKAKTALLLKHKPEANSREFATWYKAVESFLTEVTF